jgi:hypothetical protein
VLDARFSIEPDDRSRAGCWTLGDRLVFAARTGGGQPIVENVDSIEWMVADSSVIVRGTIVAHKSEEEPSGTR